MFLICSFVDMMICFSSEGRGVPFCRGVAGRGGAEGGYYVVNYQCWFWGARQWVVSMCNCIVV